jgi:hypothetical protein
MMQLKDILNEILNTYQVEGTLVSSKDENISDILNQIRGIRKVTVLNNITPDDVPQREDTEITKFELKFVSRTNEPKKDIEKFKKDILQSDYERNDLKVPGVRSVDFNLETLKRL